MGFNVAVEENRIWRGTPSSEILSTSDFPIKMMLDALPAGWDGSRGTVIDAGSGSSDRKAREMLKNHIHPIMTDINEGAIGMLKACGFFAETSDATKFGSGEMFWMAPGMIEIIKGVLFQATLNSLLGETWKDAIEAADVVLHPDDGHIFMSIYLDGSSTYPELEAQGLLNSDQSYSRERWLRRYMTNYVAFNMEGMNFPYRVFAVGKPGEYKEKFDWTSESRTLTSEYWAHKVGYRGTRFERFSQHMDMNEVETFMSQQMGYILRERQMVMRHSRTKGIYSPGVNYVWQKPEFFRYHPWRYGLSVRDPDYFQKSKRREAEEVSPMNLREHVLWSLGILLRNLPVSQREAINRWRAGNSFDGYAI